VQSIADVVGPLDPAWQAPLPASAGGFVTFACARLLTVKLVVAVVAVLPLAAAWLASRVTVPGPVNVTRFPEIVAGPLTTE